MLLLRLQVEQDRLQPTRSTPSLPPALPASCTPRLMPSSPHALLASCPPHPAPPCDPPAEAAAAAASFTPALAGLLAGAGLSLPACAAPEGLARELGIRDVSATVGLGGGGWGMGG